MTMRPTPQAPNPLEQGPEGLKQVADDILKEISSLQKYYPFLSTNGELIMIKEALFQVTFLPDKASIDGLKALYIQLIECLNAIGSDNENVIGISAAKNKKTISLSNYLPATFEDFIERISMEKQEASYFKDGIIAASRTIVMGELPRGIAAVIPKFREAVRSGVYAEIRRHGDNEMELLKAGQSEAGLMSLLSLSEEELVQRYSEGSDNDLQLMLLVLEVRDNIDHEYGHDVRGKKPGKRRISPTEIELARKREPGIAKLWDTVRGKPLHQVLSNQEIRLQTASRVAFICHTSSQNTHESAGLRLVPDET